MQAHEDGPGRRRRRDRVELPPDSTIEAWKDEGLTYQEMVDRWYALTDGKELATRSAFNMRLSRAGKTTPKAKDQPVIPWIVETRHQSTYHMQMLRFEGMRRRGEELQPKKESKLDSFLAKRAGKTVIIYEPNSTQGFWDVPVEWFDEDIVRHPALRSLEGTRRPPTASRREAVKDRARERFFDAS